MKCKNFYESSAKSGCTQCLGDCLAHNQAREPSSQPPDKGLNPWSGITQHLGFFVMMWQHVIHNEWDMWKRWTFSLEYGTNNITCSTCIKISLSLYKIMMKLSKNFTSILELPSPVLEHLLFHNLRYVGQVHFNAVLVLICWYTHRLKVACLIQFIVHCNIKCQLSVIFITYMIILFRCYFA